MGEGLLAWQNPEKIPQFSFPLLRGSATFDGVSVRVSQQLGRNIQQGETKRTIHSHRGENEASSTASSFGEMVRGSSWGTSFLTPVGRADSNSDRTARFVSANPALALCARALS